MRRFRFPLSILLLGVSLAAWPGDQDLRFGLRSRPASWGSLPAAIEAVPADPSNPVGVTLEIPGGWAASPRWEDLSRCIEGLPRTGIALHATTELPGSPAAESVVAYLVALSDRLPDSTVSLGVSIDWERLWQDAGEDPERLAFLLKRATAAYRGEHASARLYVGGLAPGVLDIVGSVIPLDLRAYVDGFMLTGEDASGKPNLNVRAFVRDGYPGLPLWLHLDTVKEPSTAQVLTLIASSRDLVFTDVDAEEPGAAWAALVSLRSQIPEGMGPGFMSGATALRGAAGDRRDIAILNLLDDETMSQGMALVPTRARTTEETLELEVAAEDVTRAVVFPFPSGPVREVGYSVDGRKGRTTFRIPYEGVPALLLFDRSLEDLAGYESLEVEETYRIPVGVILARHQAVQQGQDVLLNHYTADAQVDYHFKLPGGTGTLDVTFMNTFFFERGVGARWVQNQMLINGVAWKGKTIPNLPIIEPEKVNTLPLALTLGHEYVYSYVKDDVVDGMPCYVVEFFPMEDAEGSYYTGRVWIEKDTFQKRRMSVRQSGLSGVQVSSEERDEFNDVRDAEGRSYRLMTSLKGQQIFSMLGRNIIGEREIAFRGVTVNGPGFRESLQVELESEKPILQDTDAGLRYLVKTGDGTREIQEETPTSRLFGLGGFYYDHSLDAPLPLFGVNYFDYDFRNRDIQVNAFAAGVVNTLSVSKKDALPKTDARADAVLFAVSLPDPVYEAGEEVEPERIKILREIASVGIGFRATEFLKVSGGLTLKYYRYGRDTETLSGYLLPKSHFDTSVNLSATYSRWGWSGSVNGEVHRRSRWDDWGDPAHPAAAADHESFGAWQATFAKTFYLPAFQKIGVSATWLDGWDLDRFSRYQFQYLGREEMAGFAGSGVRFDKGGLGHLRYDFNIANVIRFGMRVDHARVKPLSDAGLWQSHTGVGLSGSVMGPWETLWRVDVGYALASDIAPIEGDVTASIVVMKLW